jgi:cytochrome bd ubiquinol oxidase subunit I
MFMAATVFFTVMVTLVAWYAQKSKRPLQTEAAFLLLIMGLATTMTAEFVREGIRKPYIIHGLLYSNGIWAGDLAGWQQAAREAGTVLAVSRAQPNDVSGMARVGVWQVPDPARLTELTAVARGQYLYRAQCMICHTRDGFNALDHLTRAWSDEAYARGVVRTLHLSKPFMPPFVGTEADVGDLVAYLRTLSQKEADHAR